MITSKLTDEAQTTIPEPVRAALNLRSGDDLAYQIEGDQVILTKCGHATVENPFTAFEEWDSEPDRRAYASLSPR